jgi:hypothetical protein
MVTQLITGEVQREVKASVPAIAIGAPKFRQYRGVLRDIKSPISTNLPQASRLSILTIQF